MPMDTKMNGASFFSRWLTQPHLSDLSFSIIAGGKSSRFGSNKALALWVNGSPVIDSVVAAARAVTDRIIIISQDAQPYRHLDVPVYPDLIPGYGPLSGVHTALCMAGTSRVLILACDMPAVSPGFLRYMASIPTYAPVVVPESDSGLEPLHAIWHRSLTHVLEMFMANSLTGMRKILCELPCRIISKTEIYDMGLDHLSLISVNTPEALARLKDEIHSVHKGRYLSFQTTVPR